MDNQQNVNRSRRRGNRRARRQGGRRRTELNVDSGTSVIRTSIPKVLMRPSPFPPSVHNWLTFNTSFVVQGAVQFKLHEFALNTLYNFNVTGGTTHDFSGDNQLATIYESYHVERVEVRLQFQTNETTQGVIVGFVFRDSAPSTTVTTLAKAMNAMEITPAMPPLLIVPIAGNPGVRTQVMNVPLGSIVGNPLSYASDLAYTSSYGNFDPTQFVFGALIVCANGGANLTNGVTVLATFRLYVRSYSLRNLME